MWRTTFIWPYMEALVNMPGMSAAYCNRAGACFHLGDFEGSDSDASSAIGQGLTLVHLSAQPEPFQKQTHPAHP